MNATHQKAVNRTQRDAASQRHCRRLQVVFHILPLVQQVEHQNVESELQ